MGWFTEETSEEEEELYRDWLIELFYIRMPVVRTDGRSASRSVYGHVMTKFCEMGWFTYPMILRYEKTNSNQ